MKRTTKANLRLTTTTLRTLDGARLGAVVGGSDAGSRFQDRMRIWEANRELFLPPEIYLDPDHP